jgi:hypothetical protein
MTCMTSPMSLTVEPTATAPAPTLRPWQDSDIPAIVAAYRDEAMRRWLVSSNRHLRKRRRHRCEERGRRCYGSAARRARGRRPCRGACPGHATCR